MAAVRYRALLRSEMTRPQFSLRLFLLVIGIIALAVAGIGWICTYTSPGARYQRTGSHAALTESFAEDILPGATHAEVSEQIGPGEVMPLEYVDKFLQWQKEGKWPKGYFEPGDRIVEYRSSDSKLVHGLEFRRGKLIHFDPEQYSRSNSPESSLSPE